LSAPAGHCDRIGDYDERADRRLAADVWK